jgi:hypothetical protein
MAAASSPKPSTTLPETIFSGFSGKKSRTPPVELRRRSLFLTSNFNAG